MIIVQAKEFGEQFNLITLEGGYKISKKETISSKN